MSDWPWHRHLYCSFPGRERRSTWVCSSAVNRNWNKFCLPVTWRWYSADMHQLQRVYKPKIHDSCHCQNYFIIYPYLLWLISLLLLSTGVLLRTSWITKDSSSSLASVVSRKARLFLTVPTITPAMPVLCSCFSIWKWKKSWAQFMLLFWTPVLWVCWYCTGMLS